MRKVSGRMLVRGKVNDTEREKHTRPFFSIDQQARLAHEFCLVLCFFRFFSFVLR